MAAAKKPCLRSMEGSGLRAVIEALGAKRDAPEPES